MTDGFWRQRRVFITGHTGFKGSWLALLLSELGASVAGYALPAATQPSLFELARVAEAMRSIEGDVRELDRLEAVLRDSAPEVVFHLAAQSLVRPSYDDPVGTFTTNITGTVNLLEACRKVASVRAVVVVTSDKCYEENVARLPYKESDPLGGHDPYSASKACAEIVTAAYRKSFFEGHGSAISVASARAGNVIGGGDWAADRLIPDLINAFRMGQQPCLRNPAATRPWQHMLDPLWGYLLLAERLHAHDKQAADGWNFGPAPDSAADVQTVAERMARLWGVEPSWTQPTQRQPREATSLALDASKARNQLGWRPRFDLGTALDWTVSWYKDWHQGRDARSLVVGQIKRFMEGRL